MCSKNLQWNILSVYMSFKISLFLQSLSTYFIAYVRLFLKSLLHVIFLSAMKTNYLLLCDLLKNTNMLQYVNL